MGTGRAQAGKPVGIAGDLLDDPPRRRRGGKAYDTFGDGGDGLAGAVTARPEAQALRLSVVYAALDGSSTIKVPHLEAALAVWNYCEASAYTSSASHSATRSPTGCWRRCARPAATPWTPPRGRPCSVAT